jgi:hypothetical protein
MHILVRLLPILAAIAVVATAIAFAIKSDVPEPLVLAGITFVLLIAGLWLTRHREQSSIDVPRL